MIHPRNLPRVSLLVTDLDDTLWDWFAAWHASFSAMLKKLSELSGVPQRQLEQEIQAVHRRRGTSEYSYLLNELPSLLEKNPTSKPSEVYDEALHVQNKNRVQNTKLYEGVKETLQELQRRKVPVAAYTESISYWSEWRIRRTGLDGLIKVMYSSPDHDFPNGISAQQLRTQPPSAYGLHKTVHKQVPPGVLKPNADVLRSILSDFAVRPQEAVYVGDSLMKDIVMAQDLGVHDVHAQYGVSHDKDGYNLLRRVSHWTSQDIEREKELSTRPTVTPSHVLPEGFAQILTMFRFEEA
ncbi:HAD family hydrolase [Streptomyces prunicolor]|uniref:HAD family hydrolase n=1 Tax=Streptomyces prunicolor TaxID=67348 RepID=UPI00224FE8CC|nr:HAD family hydrolase [Streptomyces prunicolor]MCX5236170.1 HAD family hydrolase [Streptomyces prunicolor]